MQENVCVSQRGADYTGTTKLGNVSSIVVQGLGWDTNWGVRPCSELSSCTSVLVGGGCFPLGTLQVIWALWGELAVVPCLSSWELNSSIPE